MAGIVPILRGYNESVGNSVFEALSVCYLLCPQITHGTVTEKEGSQLILVLKELHRWLGDFNTKEMKTKQKLMRNLRVRWNFYINLLHIL